MRTLHLTNILLPLSLITAPCLSPSQRSTQSCSLNLTETRAPQTSSSPRAGMEDTCPCPLSCRAVFGGCCIEALCGEEGVCSLHGELCYYLILAVTSCRLLGRLVIKHAATSPRVLRHASVDNNLTRKTMTDTLVIYILM